MPEPLIAEQAAETAPYASVEELKAEHSTLLRRRRDGFQDDPSVFLGEVEIFLKRGYASGSVLGDDAERYAAESLLTYWSNVLYRAGREVPEQSLAEFDPRSAPVLEGALCPYVAMDQLKDGELLRWSGWHRLVGECLKALEQDRFLAIVGARGTGRLALIRGGVIPALKTGGLPGSEDWRYLPSLDLGAAPLTDLLRHLHPQADGDWIAARAAAVHSVPAELIAPSESTELQPAVLILEQFDDLFERSDKTEIRGFVEALLVLARDPSARYQIVLGMRPENLSLISAIGRFGKVFQRNQVLLAFTNRELRQMVEEPAKRIGLKYDDGVVDRLLLDVQGDSAALALLQFTLIHLWNNRQGNRITHELYDTFGGGRLAVARQAEKIFSSLPADQQWAARFALLKLVRLESSAQVVCQSAPLGKLHPPQGATEAVTAALGRLEDGQIVVKAEDPQSGAVSYGLVHDAVATTWPRFVEWLDQVRAQQRWHLQMRAAAEQWRDQGRNAGALWRGGTLEQADQERARLEAAGQDLTALEQDFLHASQRAQTRWIWMRRGLITSAIAGTLVIAGLYSAMSAAKEKAKTATAKAEAAAADLKASAAEAEAEASELKASAARSDAEAKKALAEQEKRSKQELGMEMAHWSTGEAIRLDESESDSSGSFLWLAQAWRHLKENGEALDESARADLQAEYRLRLGIALRGLPRVSRLLYHENQADSAVSDDGRFSATVGRNGTVFHWNVADGKHDYSWSLTEDQRPGALAGQGPIINGVSLSPDGNYAVVCTGEAGAGERVFVCDIAAKTPRVLPNSGHVILAAFHPNPRNPLLVTAGESANGRWAIKLWTVGTWDQERGVPLEIPGMAKSIAFSPNDSRLAVAGKNEKDGRGFCIEWDLNQPAKPPTQYDIASGNRSTRSANHIAYSPDGKQLAVACGGESDAQYYTCLFNTNTAFGAVPAQFLVHAGAVNRVSFSLIGKRLVTASEDGTAKVWVLTEGPRGSLVSAPKTLVHGSSVFAADFSPDGQYVATASRDLTARIWDAETGEAASASLKHSGSVDYAKFTPDGRQLITHNSDMLHVWHLSSAVNAPFQFTVPSTSGIDHLHCDPKTLRVAVAGHDTASNAGWAQVWDGRTGKQLGPDAGLPHPRRVTGSALSPSGGLFLATVCDDSYLRVWNLASGQRTCELRPFANDQVRVATFSPDGSRLVAAGGDRVTRRGVAMLWSFSADGKLNALSPALEQGASINFVAFNQKGDRFITVTGDTEADRGEAKIWDLSGKAIELKDKDGFAHPQGIKSAAFSSDGRRLVTASVDNTARVWNADDGSLVHELVGHTADVISASFSDQGDYAATSSMDRNVIIWKMSSGKQIAVLAHKNPVNRAVFARDSRYVVTACCDGAARIWAIGRGGRLVAIKKQPGSVMEVGYTGDASGMTIGMFSLRSPVPAWDTSVPGGDNRRISPSPDHHVSVGVWDIPPGDEPSVGPLMRLGAVVAARRVELSGEEVKLVTVPEAEQQRAWQDSQTQNEVGQRVETTEWHNRMAANFEARRNWQAAIWHLDFLDLVGYDQATTLIRRARANMELGRADQALRSASLTAALADLNRVISADAKNGQAHVDRALIHLEREAWAEAANDFSKAMQRIQGDKRLWTGRAKAREGQKNWVAAIADFREALRLDPEDGAVHVQLAIDYRTLKEYAKAADEFGKAARILPNDLDIRMHRAAALGQLRQNAEAIKEYASVARDFKIHWQLEKAAQAYTKALLLKPERDEGPLHSELAETLAALGRRGEAIKEYAKALELQPAEGKHWSGLARVHAAMGDWAKARDAYSKAIDRNPGDSALVQSRAWALAQTKEWGLAARDYETAIKLQPKNYFLWWSLVDAYLNAANPDEAIRCLEKMTTANPSDEFSGVRLATVRLLKKDFASYRATCERLLDRFDQTASAPVANNVAWACALGPNALKDPNRAVRLARKAVELRPSPDHLDTLGAVLYRAGDMEGAIKLLSEPAGTSATSYLVKTNSTAVYDQLFRAMALERSGHADEAKELLETVIQELDVSEQDKIGSPRTLVLNSWQKREMQILRDEAEKLIKGKP